MATETLMAIGTTTNDDNMNSPPPMFAPTTLAVVIWYPIPRMRRESSWWAVKRSEVAVLRSDLSSRRCKVFGCQQ